MSTSCLGLIGDHFSGHRRERVLGFMPPRFPLLLAGVALIYGGRLVDLGGWQTPFALYLLGMPTLLVSWFVIRNAALAPEDAAEKGVAAARDLAHVWPYYVLLILLTLGMFTPSIQAVSYWLLAYAQRRNDRCGDCLHVFRRDDNCLGVRVSAPLDRIARFPCARCVQHGLRYPADRPVERSVDGVPRLRAGRHRGGHVRTGHCIAAVPPHGACGPRAGHGLIVSALNAGQFLNPLLFDPLRRGLGVSGAFVALGLCFSWLQAVCAAQSA